VLLREEGKFWRSSSGGLTLKFRFARSKGAYFQGIKRIPVRITVENGLVFVVGELRGVSGNDREKKLELNHEG